MTEILEVTDEQGKVLGREERRVIHEKGLWHRVVHVFIFTPDSKLLVQKRSSSKDVYPSTYECSVGEHVKPGESFEGAARRGLREELGISSIKLKPLLKYRLVYDSSHKEISTLFSCEYNGRLKLERSEVESIAARSPDELAGLMEKRPERFAPWARELLRWYLKRESGIEKL